MLKQIYSVYDSVSQIYNTPMMFINEQDAVRSAHQIAQTEGTPIHASPADYTLFHLGSFDDSAALYELLETPVRILSFHEIIKKTQNETNAKISELDIQIKYLTEQLIAKRENQKDKK